MIDIMEEEDNIEIIREVAMVEMATVEESLTKDDDHHKNIIRTMIKTVEVYSIKSIIAFCI